MSFSASVGISLSAVTKVFPGGVRAVGGAEPVTAEIVAGEFQIFLGPSGCGKSTLLRLIAGLDVPTTGTISLTPGGGGKPQSAVAGDIAYVFQEPHLLPWRNVLRNAALPLELMGVPKAKRLEQARLALADVGLSDFAAAYPAQLSGGMKMRVSLARALITRPKLLLLDEPFAALDEITRQRLDDMLRDIWARTGMTVVFVTHSVAEAVFLGRRAWVFSQRPARIVLDTPIDLPEARIPALRTDARFAEIAHRLSASLAETQQGAEVLAAHGLRDGGVIR